MLQRGRRYHETDHTKSPLDRSEIPSPNQRPWSCSSKAADCSAQARRSTPRARASSPRLRLKQRRGSDTLTVQSVAADQAPKTDSTLADNSDLLAQPLRPLRRFVLNSIIKRFTQGKRGGFVSCFCTGAFPCSIIADAAKFC